MRGLACVGVPYQSDPLTRVPPLPLLVLGIRLLGWAYFTLCVGYSVGLAAELNQERNKTVLWLGITSNEGSTFLLLYFVVFDTLFRNSLFARTYLLVSGAATFFITLGLARAALRTDET